MAVSCSRMSIALQGPSIKSVTTCHHDQSATGYGLQVFFAHSKPTTKSFDCYHTQRRNHVAKVDADDLRHSVADYFRMITEMPKVFMNALLRFWR